MLLPNPSIAVARTQLALARDEVTYVGQPVAVVIADTRYIAEDAAAALIVQYDVLPAASDCRAAAEEGAPRAHSDLEFEHRLHVSLGLRRRRRRLCRCRARVHAKSSGSTAAAAWRWRRARCCQSRSGLRSAHRLVGNANPAYRPPHARRSAWPRSAIDPHDRARCRRRLRAEGDLLSGRGGDPGGSAETRPAGEMDRGSPRAFSLRDAGARSILGRRHRGRRGGKNPRPARPHAARYRRVRAVGYRHALYRRLDGARSLRGSRLSARYGRGAHQQGADHAGARRRPAAGGVRDGAAAGPRRARIEARSRRGAPPQFDPARADALRGRAHFRDGKPLVYDSGDYPRDAGKRRLRSPSTKASASGSKPRSSRAASSASGLPITSKARASVRSRA